MSRSPVQAAFNYLAQQGVLEARRPRGFLVKRVADKPSAGTGRGFELYDRIIDDMAQGALAGSVSESALMRARMCASSAGPKDRMGTRAVTT